MALLKLQHEDLSYDCIKVSIALNYSTKSSIKTQFWSSSREKLPRLEIPGEEGAVDHSTAICHYYSPQLFTSTTNSAEVIEWVSIADNHLHPAVMRLISPFVGAVMYNSQVEKEAENAINSIAGVLNGKLLHETYMSGDVITMADISLCCALYPAMRIFLDDQWRAKYANLTRWYMTVTNQYQVSSVLANTDYARTRPKFNMKQYKEMQQGKKMKEEKWFVCCKLKT